MQEAFHRNTFMKISCLAVKNDKDLFDNVYTFAMTEIFGKKSGKNYFQV